MDAQLVSILVFLAIGAVAGWLAGQIMKGGGFGLLSNIIIGIVGSFIGGFLFGRFISGGLIGAIVTATLGAVVLLAV
ncbi:MAG: GlsB/YeaQ/YmgE family stress response membrane protein, partial [Sulfurovaceae bacterium]